MKSSNQEEIFKLYSKVGLIVGLSQMLEYNLATIFANNAIILEFEKNPKEFHMNDYKSLVKIANEWYEALQHKTFGFILTEINSIRYFTLDFQKRLGRILSKRNYVVHQMFKDDIGKDEIYFNPIKSYFMLDHLIEEMNKVNKDLCLVIDTQKDDLKKIY